MKRLHSRSCVDVSIGWLKWMTHRIVSFAASSPSTTQDRPTGNSSNTDLGRRIRSSWLPRQLNGISVFSMVELFRRIVAVGRPQTSLHGVARRSSPSLFTYPSNYNAMMWMWSKMYGIAKKFGDGQFGTQIWFDLDLKFKVLLLGWEYQYTLQVSNFFWKH